MCEDYRAAWTLDIAHDGAETRRCPVPLQALWGALIADCFGREAFGRVMGLMGPLMLPLNVSALQLAPWSFDATGSYQLAIRVFLGWLAVAAGALAFVRLPAPSPHRG